MVSIGCAPDATGIEGATGADVGSGPWAVAKGSLTWAEGSGRSNSDVTLSCEGHLYTMSGNDAFVDHLRYEVHCDVAVVDRPEDIDEDVIKIAFQTPEVDQPAALEYFERLFSDRVDVMTSGTEWTDFIGFGSGKGSALADYGRALGISPDEMMAFGDNENDRDMLNVVGHPYLMESCNPSMRGINDRVRYVRTVEEELRRLLAE